MSQIIITEKASHAKNIIYVQTCLSEMLSNVDCRIKSTECGDRAKITVDCPESYYEVIKTEIAEMVSEVVTVGYKYDFLKKEVKVGGLNEEEKEYKKQFSK